MTDPVAIPRPDPVAALNYALTEAGRDALGYAPEGGLQGVAQKALPYLAEQGYVLVDADMLRGALEDEDEIAHAEAWHPQRKKGLGVCAYCDHEWPCRTQRGIDRLLAALQADREATRG